MDTQRVAPIVVSQLPITCYNVDDQIGIKSFSLCEIARQRMEMTDFLDVKQVRLGESRGA
ncbi:hypothetical protein D3C85_1639620 [compost metagenome]